MKEIQGEAWELQRNYTYLGITTNGFIKKDGTAVMGRGIAYEAQSRYPGIRRALANLIRENGNVVQEITDNLVAFPVKHNWFDKADIELIKRSCKQLMGFLKPDETILLPKPGCGNGGLHWSDVKPIIETLLDDRVTIISRHNE